MALPVLSNVINPDLYPIITEGLVESISKEGVASSAFLAYTRAGALPASDGAYAAGVCVQDTLATERASGLRTVGYAVIKVRPTVAIAVDAPISIGTDGCAIAVPGSGTPYVFGRAVTSSNGSGTSQVPHYIVVKIN